MGIILTVHGLVLFLLDEVANPPLAIAFIVALAVWRLSNRLVARSDYGGSHHVMILSAEGGSLVLAAALVTAEGGTESPFFFWPLILLAWCALIFTRRQLAVMVGITVASYIGVVVLASDITATSLARLGLLLAFAGVLIVARSRIDYHRASAERSERLLRDAIGVTPAGLMVLGAEDNQPVYINHAAHEMRLLHGLEESTVGSGRLREIVDEAIETAMTIGPELLESHDLEAAARHIRVLATPHESRGERMVVVAAEDVTHQVEVGEERRSFFRFAGHQLRTPLTPIIAYAEMLKRGELEDEPASRAADEIESSARELLRLCERMLTVADLQHGTETETGIVRVGDILDRVEQSRLDDVEMSGNRDLGVLCNFDLVARALTELIDNSRQFGEAPIHLEWYDRGETIVFKVWDEGSGPEIDSAADLMFAHWGSTEPARMMTPGMRSRLGLVQARLLVSLSDGNLSFARGEDGLEWWFQLRLPTERSAQQAVAQ
ncbi:MAG: histidine kinase dimerization/phospho-acceptor domain-containing protein [Actinomycetota bacterium]